MAKELGLSSAQVAEFREAFNIFDKDGDGRINEIEFGVILRSFGQTPTESKIREIFSKSNIEAGQTIDFNKFLKLMSEYILEADSEEDLVRAIKVFDTDKDGKITRKQLDHIIKSLGNIVIPPEIDELILQADQEKNGLIDYKMLVDLMLKM